MKVIISETSRAKVYHRPGCCYEARIADRHWTRLTTNQAYSLGFRPCKYCGNLKGAIRALPVSLEQYAFGRDMEITYRQRTGTVFIRTDIGFWKTYWKDGFGLLLYHLNVYDKSKSTEELADGSYHRQKDVKPTESLGMILNYIEEHDRAKQIIEEDYRKLPQKTKRQKKYYRIAERREKSRQIRRVYDIFELLEREREAKEAMKKRAVC